MVLVFFFPEESICTIEVTIWNFKVAYCGRFQKYLMPIILLFNQRCIPRDIWAVPSFCYTLYMSFFWCSLTKISLLVVFLLMQCIYKPVFNGFSFYLLLLFCLHWNTKNSMCWISILINPISYIYITLIYA